MLEGRSGLTPRPGKSAGLSEAPFRIKRWLRVALEQLVGILKLKALSGSVRL